MTLNTSLFSKRVSELSGVPLYLVKEVLYCLGDALAVELLKGNEVKLIRLGTFKLYLRKPTRYVTWLRKGQRLDKPEWGLTKPRRVVSFSASILMKKKVNHDLT